jgi:hypothetical protein
MKLRGGSLPPDVSRARAVPVSIRAFLAPDESFVLDGFHKGLRLILRQFHADGKGIDWIDLTDLRRVIQKNVNDLFFIERHIEIVSRAPYILLP